MYQWIEVLLLLNVDRGVCCKRAAGKALEYLQWVSEVGWVVVFSI